MTMRMSLHNVTRTVTSTLALAAAGCLVAGSLSGAVLNRLSSDFQNTADGVNEIATSAPALAGGAGGTVIYEKTVTVPDALDVLFIEFEGQGDVHNGSALLMNASIVTGTPLHPVETLCEPLRGSIGPGGGGPHLQTGWFTLLNLPQPPVTAASLNCKTAAGVPGDGGGGSADCHDNTIVFSCCARLTTPDATARVRIKLANLPGTTVAGDNTSFIERSTIYVDGVADPSSALHPGTQCLSHGSP
jgi:hypothetical protein